MNSILKFLLLCLLASACTLTKHLPESEKLYRGIKSIDYDKEQDDTGKGQEEGVITALADAYTKVEGLLTGDASVLNTENVDDKAVRDSMKRVSQKDQKAYAAAKEEVEAVLSYAPNGAFMGSSYVTHPFPMKLLIYNRYAGSKHRFGKWMFNNFASPPVLISNVNPSILGDANITQEKKKEPLRALTYSFERRNSNSSAHFMRLNTSLRVLVS